MNMPNPNWGPLEAFLHLVLGVTANDALLSLLLWLSHEPSLGQD